MSKMSLSINELFEILIHKITNQVDRIQEVEGNVASAGKSVAAVVRRLATKDDGVFGPTLKSFISCTISAKVTDPYVSLLIQKTHLFLEFLSFYF